MAARRPHGSLPARALLGLALLAGFGTVVAGGANAAGRGASGRAAAAPATVELAPPGRPGADAGAAPVVLPRDAGPHHGLVEWWYFNGHLSGTDPSGRLHDYGFEYVTFQFVPVPGLPAVYVGQLSIADLARRTFRFDGVQAASPVPSTPGRFVLHTGAWSMSGAGGTDHLSASMPGYALRLRLVATEPPVLEGPRGIIDLGPFGRVDYYSYTSLRARGTIVDHGVPITVSGISWMDHEWGADVFSGAGWDWFSIQLTNGRQYMLYFVRDKAGRMLGGHGTHLGPAGVTYLTPAEIAEHAVGSWTSPATHITYGSGWQLSVPHGHLSVTPDLLDQEVDEAHATVYWEGDCTVTGVIDGQPVHGVAYTEIDPPGQTGA